MGIDDIKYIWALLPKDLLVRAPVNGDYFFLIQESVDRRIKENWDTVAVSALLENKCTEEEIKAALEKYYRTKG